MPWPDYVAQEDVIWKEVVWFATVPITNDNMYDCFNGTRERV